MAFQFFKRGNGPIVRNRFIRFQPRLFQQRTNPRIHFTGFQYPVVIGIQALYKLRGVDVLKSTTAAKTTSPAKSASATPWTTKAASRESSPTRKTTAGKSAPWRTATARAAWATLLQILSPGFESGSQDRQHENGENTAKM